MIKLSLNVAALVLGLAAAAFPAMAQQSKPLAYSNYLPQAHPSNHYAFEPLFKTVEEETKGSFKINLHSGGVLVGAKGTLQAIRDGLVDGGIVVTLYNQNELPLNTALSDLAFFAGDPLAVIGAVNETVLLNCPECLQEYHKYKTIPMAGHVTTPYYMMCKKPVQSLGDLKGLKMRAAGGVYGRWAVRLGGVPVNISNDESYEAIERGQLDCVIGALGWLKTLSLWDVAKNVIDLPMGAYFGGTLVGVSQESWKKVKESDRAVFLKHLPAAVARFAIGYAKDESDVLAQAKAKGVQIRKPDQALVTVLDQYREGEIRNAIDTAKKRGVKNPEPTIDAFLKNLKKWQAIVAKTGNDQAKFEQALREEIYNKVKF